MAKGDKRVILGSGKLYVAEATFTNGVPTIPEDSVLEIETNRIGDIQGGASLSYKPEFYECEDDLGLVKKQFLTKEEVTLKSGIMTWNTATLKKLCSTATVAEDSVKHTRTVKIGGVGNQDGKSYVIRFLHEDAVNGNLRVTIVGSNQSGFEMAFAKDKESVINAEFKAIPSDATGTLVIVSEDTSAV